MQNVYSSELYGASLYLEKQEIDLMYSTCYCSIGLTDHLDWKTILHPLSISQCCSLHYIKECGMFGKLELHQHSIFIYHSRYWSCLLLHNYQAASLWFCLLIVSSTSMLEEKKKSLCQKIFKKSCEKNIKIPKK